MTCHRPTISPHRLPFLRSNSGNSLPALGMTTWFGLAVAAAVWIILPCWSGEASPLVAIAGETPGATPFISMVNLQMNDPSELAYVQFTVLPKPGSLTRSVSARYSSAYLQRRGFLNLQTNAFTVPVFGLYADYANTVNLVSTFADGTSQIDQIAITTAKYHAGIYNHPNIVQARSGDTNLSYDFIMLKSFATGATPVIIDTDGAIRWVGTANVATLESIFLDNSIFLSNNATAVLRMELDGAVNPVADLASQGVTLFHHNFDFGKSGILTDVNTAEYNGSTNIEIDTAGNVLHTWDLAAIISAAMIAGGDDPTQFVAAPGTQADWFHNNAAAYRPSDDSIVISSRENFVICLDYSSGAIKWILGDPTKQWHQFPSLQKYALVGTPGTHYPIGQHAVSIFHDKLLLFDDGYYSADHTPKGHNRTYSAPRKYSIDLNNGTATETWNYLADPAIYSPITSSVYEDQPGNYLVDYATADNYSYAEILGLDHGVKVFDYQFTELDVAGTAWNSVPLHIENLVFN